MRDGRAQRRSRCGALATDERGAIMLIATFMAIFIAGAMFYLVGLADAALQRTAMQDAADAVALSAAVVHAKGMNTIVLVNFVMAALVAVLIAIRIVETVALAAATTLAVASFWLPPAAGGAAAMGKLAKQANVQFEKRRPQVHAGLRKLNRFAHMLSRAIPVAATVRAVETGVVAHRPRVKLGVAAPEAAQLPIEDGEFEVLCSKAGELAGQLAVLPFKLALDKLGVEAVSDIVYGVVSEATEGLAKSAPGWFCGVAGARAPRITHALTRHLPEIASARACRLATESGEGDMDALCARSRADAQAATPHPATGDCQKACGPDGPYLQRAAAARTQCDPDARKGLYNYAYQQRIVEKEYRDMGAGFRFTGRERALSVTLERTRRPPCPGDRDGWNTSMTDEHGKPRPLCSDETRLVQALRRQSRSRRRGGRGDSRWVRVTEVAHLLQCQVDDQIEIKPSGRGGLRASPPDRKTGSPRPLRLEAGLVQGQAPFQLRSIARGRALDSLPDRILGGAASGQADAPVRHGRAAGRISLAQAEYYFHTAGQLDQDAMWEMGWTARFRRFRLPIGDAVWGGRGGRRSGETSAAAGRPPGDPSRGQLAIDTLTAACRGMQACKALQDASLNDLIAH